MAKKQNPVDEVIDNEPSTVESFDDNEPSIGGLDTVDPDNVSINSERIEETSLAGLILERQLLPKGQYTMMVRSVDLEKKGTESTYKVKLELAETGVKDSEGRPMISFSTTDRLTFWDDSVKNGDSKKQMQTSMSLKRAGMLVYSALSIKTKVDDLVRCVNKKVLVDISYKAKTAEYEAGNNIRSYLPLSGDQD